MLSCCADDEMKVICSWNAVTPLEIRSERVKSGDPWMSTPVNALIWAQWRSFREGLRRSITEKRKRRRKEGGRRDGGGRVRMAWEAKDIKLEVQIMDGRY